MSEAEAVQISSNALLLIGADTINSFTDGTNEATVAAALYDRTVNAVLAEKRWNFTVFQRQASKLVAEPESKWQVAYVLPSTIIRIHRVDPEFIRYELYGGNQILTNFDGDLFIDGQFRVDELDWPDYFTEYVELRLAQKFIMPITDDEGKVAMIKDMVIDIGRKARTADGQQRKGVGVRAFPLIDSRG